MQTVGRWLIERSEPEGQSPTCFWTGAGWTTDPLKAMQHPTKIRALETLDNISGIAGVHSPMGHVADHVFIGNRPSYDDLLMVAKIVLARLDVEAKTRGELCPFVCNALRPDLRAAISRAEANECLDSAHVATRVAAMNSKE